MTDQRTLKRIINEQRAEIQQLKESAKQVIAEQKEFTLSEAKRYEKHLSEQDKKVTKLEKQVEAAKTYLSAFLNGINYPQEMRQKIIDLVFSEGFSAEKSSLESAQNRGETTK